MFKLVDAWQEESNARKVFKFKLELTDEDIDEPKNESIEIEHNRIIPTSVKLEVWKRDKGKCVICESTDNLHFDHIIPYSKGGSSLVAENIQLLCARHNLEKRRSNFVSWCSDEINKALSDFQRNRCSVCVK